MDIQRDNSLKRSVQLILLAGIAAAPMAFGQSDENRTNVGFTVGAGFSDNLFQANGGTSTGRYESAGVLLDLNRQSTRLQATVTGDIEYRFYQNVLAEDEPYGAFEADIELFAVPDRLSWVLEESYGEGRTDPFLATGPNNREQVNIYATGPAAYLPLGERTEIRLSALTGQRNYETTSGLDNDTFLATGGIFRDLSTTSEIGVAVSSREVEYDAPAFDNTIDAAYLSYNKRFASGSARLEIGTNKVEFATRDDNAPYFVASWGRDVGTRSRLALSFENELVDAGDTFRGGQDTDDSLLTVDVYERSSAGMSFSVDRGRTLYSVGGRVGEDDYQNDFTFNNDLLTLNFDVEHAIATNMEFGARVFYTERDFIVRNEYNEDLSLTLELERRFSSKLSLFAELEHVRRSGRNAATFDENGLRVRVQYDLNPRAESER
jgi:hypothetical protein